MPRTLARKIANSFLLHRGRALFNQNSKEWNCLPTKWQKLQAGVYLILQDYSTGLFPPKFEDQAKAYAAEMNYRSTLPGVDLATVNSSELKKPFWFGPVSDRYFTSFTKLVHLLEDAKIAPPARLLELGCGTGWMSEFLAIMGFDVTGTSIAPTDIDDARARIKSIAVKGITAQLRFERAPMETVDEMVGPLNHYDAVFVFEALHHAYDWRQSLRAAYQCLRPGGWMLICREPNVLHTFISYRVAKLSNAHEIGFSRRALMQHLARTGFTNIKYKTPYFHFWVKDHWIVARKPVDQS